MKKSCFLYLTLTLVIAISLVVFTRVICEDEIIFENLYISNSFFRYDELLINVLSQRGIFYEHRNYAFSSQPIISYLARHEKSPPLAIPTVIL